MVTFACHISIVHLSWLRQVLSILQLSGCPEAEVFYFFHPNSQINHRAPVIHCCQCRFKPILPIHPFLSTATLFISKDQWRWLQRYFLEPFWKRNVFGVEMFVHDWLELVGSRWFALEIKGRRYHGEVYNALQWLNSVWRLVRACPLFWVGGMLSIGNLLRFGHKWSHGTDVG